MNRDEQILALKEDIAALKMDLPTKKHVYKTNCALYLFGSLINLHALGAADLLYIYGVIQKADELAKERGITTELSGFPFSAWLEDINSAIENKVAIVKRKQLDIAEATLEKLISTDKKAEIEIEKIKKEFGL